MTLHCAITGTSGFVGSTVVKNLINVGYQITALKRPWQLTNDIDVLIHCAAYLPPTYNDFSEIEKCMMDNYIATFNLLKDAEKYGIGTFIYLSSGQIYKWKDEIFHDDKVSEEYAIYPSNRACPYLISKMAADCLVNSYKGNIRTIVLRPSCIYGPNMKPIGVIHRLLNKIRNKEEINLKQEDYFVDLVHVEDVAMIIKNCIEKRVSGIYNVGGDDPVKIVHLAQMLGNILDIKITFQDPKKLQPGHPALNIEKARRDLKYAPKKLKEGLASYVRSL